MVKIIFFGGIGNKRDFGGELTKNKMIIDYLKKVGYNLKLVDTHNAKKKPWKILFLPLFLILYPKADLIISTSLDNVLGLLRVLKKWGWRRNIIYWGIGGSFPKRIKEGLIDRDVLSILNLIIVEGTSMKDILLGCGFQNVIVCPNFKKIYYLPQIKKNHQITRFVFLSRIQPEKGVRHILNVADRLIQSGLSGKFVVDFYGGVGADYLDEFTAEINRLPDVNYKGTMNLSQKEGYDILASYSVMLFPTFWHGEGFPGVVIDAYISGLPIIATDWNLNKEFIFEKRTGFIIPLLDVEEELYSIMLTIINGEIDLEGMSKECQQMAKNFDVDNAIKEAKILSYL